MSLFIVINDDPPPLRRGELGAERHLGADGVRAHPRVHDAVHVVQRQRVKDLIRAVPAPRLHERIDLRGERRVRVQRGFRRAGRAAGEDDEGAVVWCWFGTARQVVARCRVEIARDVVDVSQGSNGAQRTEVRDFVEEVVGDEDNLHPRLAYRVRELPDGMRGRQRNRYPSEPPHGEHRGAVFRAGERHHTDGLSSAPLLEASAHIEAKSSGPVDRVGDGCFLQFAVSHPPAVIGSHNCHIILDQLPGRRSPHLHLRCEPPVPEVSGKYVFSCWFRPDG